MNYSTLLTRSTDFGTGKPPDPTNPGLPEYAYPLYQSYPNELERPLLFSMMQTLWDRAEADGYALHMTSDPLPNTPAHKVLMQAGLGDHQVTQVAAETEARTIGAFTREPYADPGRDNDVTPGFGMPRIGSYPFDGSAFMLFDIGPRRQEDGATVGTDPPPTTNTPPARRGLPAGPARVPAPVGRRAPPEGRVPADRRPGDRRVRRAPVLRGQLARAL